MSGTRPAGHLTASELAELHGVGVVTIRRWSRLPGFPPGRSWVAPGGRRPAQIWPSAKVDEWLRGCEAAAELEAAAHTAEVAAREQAREQRRYAHRQLVITLIEMMEAGATWDEMAAKTGRPRETIINLAKKEDIRGLYQHSRAGGGRVRHGEDACVDALLSAAETLDGGQVLTRPRYQRWRLLSEPDAPHPEAIAKTLGGTWTESLRLVGLESAEGHPRRHWTDDELLDALVESDARTHAQYNAWRGRQPEPKPSTTAISLRFGSWTEALRMVGRDATESQRSAAARRRKGKRLKDGAG